MPQAASLVLPGSLSLSAARLGAGLLVDGRFPVDEEEVPHREVGANIAQECDSPVRMENRHDRRKPPGLAIPLTPHASAKRRDAASAWWPSSLLRSAPEQDRRVTGGAKGRCNGDNGIPSRIPNI